ncbi:related to feruloyl esterase B precursor [Phialocephala subalpina]|uniref:Carboxylic ester hydrolase n=1 Tax=Phialocephala subalpina TaxID=576137 RepID=A0A1L7WV70_9HELO|nr:related to feruloyl esterase B precursor [Phialocephala subalpina]
MSAVNTISAALCSTNSFQTPAVYGAEILSLEATLHYSVNVPLGYYTNNGAVHVTDANFCNVTISYTHPGQNDTIHVQVWLPEESWNRRMQGIGCGGWAAGLFYLSFMGMTATGRRICTLSTDAGLGSLDPRIWALLSPGNVNMNGCSQGGRQGLVLAQRYPDAYDGIAASAPAINWAAGIASCDGSDGVLDGVISDPCLCTFDPQTLVGTLISCTDIGGTLEISAAAAAVAEATWGGARSVNNSSLWFGVNQDATLTGFSGLAGTSCTNGTCVSATFSISGDWIKLFILKNSTDDLSNMSHTDFDHILRASVQQYSSIIGTADPDLSEFRNRSGKMDSFHGLADPIIPPMGSKHYYDAVTALNPSIHDYYRLFFAPGITHCFGGSGAFPDTTFAALRRWVENGTAPDIVNATSVVYGQGLTFERLLCPYP